MAPGGGRAPLTGGGAASGAFGGRSMTPSTGMPNHAPPTTQAQPKKKPQSEPQSAPRPRSGGHSSGGHHR
jgi:hypothetical protein